MVRIMVLVSIVMLFVQAVIGLSYFISSVYEREKRAAWFAGGQFLGMAGLLAAFLTLDRIGFFRTGAGAVLLVCGFIAVGLVVFVVIKEPGNNPRALEGTKGLVCAEVLRFDEREQVFARNRSLRPGSVEYEKFYRDHPEYKNYDEARRQKGGPLGAIGSIDGISGKVNVEATLACASIPQALSTPELVKPRPVSKPMYQTSPGQQAEKHEKAVLSAQEATERIKGYALRLGADLVGVAELNPLWAYSNRGEIFRNNWEDWGRQIEPDRYAVVFATEMALEMLGAAPHTPTVIESMRNYAKGAVIAAQLARFIANLGYSATANHFRHYDNLLVPLAVDAGLGELGRLGYLITKEYGPRIRLAAVTTDLPLVSDKPADLGVVDFCNICRKCALCCPSNSIPAGERTVVNGTLRWKLNEQTCFDYWGRIGTDCNVCMRVCPWSHARSFPHRVIVELITANKKARRLFSVMDDIFYGKKPKPKKPPRWAAW